MNPVYIGVIVFVLTYVMIISEKLDRTVVALLGALLLVLLNVITQESAVRHIDFNTIGLLVGMMVIVNILKQTGVFEYFAVYSAKLANGNPVKLLLYYAIITALSSAFLDNVTTILLIVPVTIEIARKLKISPIPFIVAEILATNIGGAATLIGDPPNIMIGSAISFGFLDFIVVLMPLMIILFIVMILIVKRIYKTTLVVSEAIAEKMNHTDETRLIKNKRLLWYASIVLGLTILGFLFSDLLHLQSATVALMGATILFVITKIHPEDILIQVEWDTLFFFGGLFVIVGALSEVGVITYLAEQFLSWTNGSLLLTSQFVLWISALLSSFLDNIPFVATMIPLLKEVQARSTFTFDAVWWALSIGSCIGGAGTIIGASANVVAKGICEQNDLKISFISYMKVAYPIMLLLVFISSLYLIVIFIL